MYKVVDTTKLEKYGFTQRYGLWSKPIEFDESPCSFNESQAYLQVGADGRLSVEFDFKSTDTGDDLSGEITIPLDEVFQLMEAGVIKKV